MLAFSLIIFVEIFVSCQDLDASRSTISSSITPFSKLKILNKLLSLEIFSITFQLGWYLYFRTYFKTGSRMSLEVESDTGYLRIMRLLVMVEKKSFRTVLASVLMILSFSSKAISLQSYRVIEFYLKKKASRFFSKFLQKEVLGALRSFINQTRILT